MDIQNLKVVKKTLWVLKRKKMRAPFLAPRMHQEQALWFWCLVYCPEYGEPDMQFDLTDEK